MKLLKVLSILLFSSSFIYGQPWEKYTSSNSPVLSGIVMSMAVDQQNNLWVGAEGLGVYNGTAWTSYTSSNSSLPSNLVSSIVVDGQGNKWIGTFVGGIARFDGTNWTVYNKSNSGLPNDAVLSMAIDRQGNKWIGTREGGLVKFDGQKWTVYNASNSGLIDNSVASITIDGQGNKWIGTYKGLVKFNGQSWTVYNTANSSLPNDAVYCVTIDSLGNKWIGTADGLAKFDGQNWTVYNNTLAFIWVTGIVIDQQWNVWVASNGGGVSKFDGQNWTLFSPSNSTLPLGSFMSIAIDKHGTKWLGSFGLLAFHDDALPSGLKEDGYTLPKEYSLKQNYPNPFNPSTSISYSLPESRFVKLTVYDMLGKEITTLVNESKQAGTHTVMFNGSGLPSGMYLYTIQAGAFRDSKKLTLLK